MFFRLLEDSVLRNRRRKVLAVVTIAIAATLMSVLAHISIDIGNKMAKELNSYETNIRILPKSEGVSLFLGGVDYNPLKGRFFLNEKDLPRIKGIFWGNNIAGFSPFLTVPVKITGYDAIPVPLVGTFFQRQIGDVDGSQSFETGIRFIKPYWTIQGAWPDDLQQNNALVGKALADALNLGVGQSLQVTPDKGAPVVLQITGILSGDDTYDHAVMVPIETVQNLAGLPDGVESIDVSAMSVPESALSRKARTHPDSLDVQEYDLWYCTSYVSSIAHQLEEAIPNALVKPVWHVAETQGAVINKIQLLMFVMTLVIFIAAGLGVATIIQTSILERSGEIALMKAIGAANHHVALLFVAEAILLGVIGGVCGYLLGMGFSQIIGFDLFTSTIAPSPIVGPVVGTYAVAISLTGTVFGLTRIRRISPTAALHGRI
ncbi:MAG: hypothetical protein A3G32_00165 [Deltaproteobacteria bacterium RIFCSPLOWO2_12_FULL_40_28]|nr:MAG: hypothetical protein A3C45_04655 [Deltaproteobacteria bacterium RIFCSPHIGHO2_02_FULL_40_28]OGQ20562.1 MAG: hypothetical protein A3E27_00930 [Deltaproteobacteria bacterium RIFCSPHIGHO2_12_FULL_40_32]OGQ41232.1 MAG: hypothetical protein A3I69_05745 [Deltaproteobacteria bacterium RIFCSPLOWO2_02_FULL_40_36]OGQ55207.1 MAG: hypothetical protein A3G32_00165 [Deltaproteobacteria bacterium RIFCSPLOWO2_12_FULL_40_28]